DLHRGQDVGQVRVCEYAAFTGTRVVTHERDGVGVAVDTFHHPERLVRSDQQRRPRVEPVEQQVSLARMCFVHENLAGAGVEEARNRRVHIVGQQATVILPARITRLAVVGTGDAGDSFHVGRDQY